MNKRIKDLIKSAGIIPEDEHYEVAELVVKECAAITRNLSPHGELAEKAVKEHFGV